MEKTVNKIIEISMDPLSVRAFLSFSFFYVACGGDAFLLLFPLIY